MALGGLVAAPSLALALTGTLTFACLVDGHVNVSPATAIPISQAGSQTTYFSMPCAQCGRAYLVQIGAPQLGLTVMQTTA